MKVNFVTGKTDVLELKSRRRAKTTMHTKRIGEFDSRRIGPKREQRFGDCEDCMRARRRVRVYDERCKDREGDGDALSGRWRVFLGVGKVESHWEVERSERE